MNRVALIAVACLSPALAAAQGNTAELLDRAARYHADLDMERELVILRQVISPNSPFVVTHEQRVLAYKYLGAALVVLGQADSGVLYFRAALERDPFVDLETQKFTPAEIAAFTQAKRLTFGLGVRPDRLESAHAQRSQVDPLAVELKLPRLDLGEEEQVADESLEPVRVSIDHLQELSL